MQFSESFHTIAANTLIYDIKRYLSKKIVSNNQPFIIILFSIVVAPIQILATPNPAIFSRYLSKKILLFIFAAPGCNV